MVAATELAELVFITCHQRISSWAMAGAGKTSVVGQRSPPVPAIDVTPVRLRHPATILLPTLASFSAVVSNSEVSCPGYLRP
jgi:hypothetical protein